MPPANHKPGTYGLKLVWNPSIVRLIFLFIPLVVAVSGLGTKVHSYPTNNRSSVTLFQEIALNAPIDPSKPVVLYDNRKNGAMALTDEPPVFERGCIYLVPAEIISVNLNMSYLFHAPAHQSKDMIGDLIYANIELKKMIERYEDIQKKAVEIAELSNSPEFLKSPYAIYMPSLYEFIKERIWKPTSSGQDMDVEKEAGQGESQSLAAQRTMVENFINRSVAEPNFLLSSAALSPALEKGSGSSSDAIVNPESRSSSAGTIVPPEKFINIARSVGGKQHFTGVVTSLKLMSEKRTSADRTQGNRELQPVSSGELPWWIRAPSEFISYCMHNKIEAGIMLLLLIFFLNMIGAIFRR